MKNVSQANLSKLLFSFFLALLLAGPVFGNEAAPADTSVAPPAKVENKVEKKGKRRHKHSKKADKKVSEQPAAQVPVAPEAPAVEKK